MRNQDEEGMKLLRNIIDGEIADIKTNWPFYYGGPGAQRPYPLHYHLLKNFRWYRRWSGGIWHHFQLESNYFTWRKMTREYGGSLVVQVEKWPEGKGDA